jgi:hypothetical protein
MSSSDLSLALGLALIGAMVTPVGWLILVGAVCLGAAKLPWWTALLLACCALPVLAMVLNNSNAPLVTHLSLLVASAIICGAGSLAGRLGRAWWSARQSAAADE